MYRPRVPHEVRSRPRMAGEEIEREHIALEPVTRATGCHQVARVIRPAARQRHDMIEGRGTVIESRRAVHAALPTVAQGGAAHGLFRRYLRRHLWSK